ncbi:hypothetical protein BBF96_14040 [Anoxybacter fermentans]|uniref:Uncharacterized protein n=1 Tax=Anoxybacter fermentans TaxID=1323375 RepID=A0A3S9T1F9_9FIRM|nr:hypothetical protein [Anoxybacter fermentans]AZR74408.1 hypothetical protein BBF96_14040 [Anoxybacter fermentans]
MKPKIYLVLIISGLLLYSISCGGNAKNTDLRYEPIEKKLKYKNQIFLESVIDTGKIHVTTKMILLSFLENEITKNENNLLLKMTFTDINLGHFKRELQILDKDVQAVDLKDKAEVEAELKDKVIHKWVNLIVDEKGRILEKYYSSDLDKVNFINLTGIAEQFFIHFPKGEVEIGQQWEEDYSSTIPPYDKGQPFAGTIKYTYLGQEERKGILCYKIQAVLFLEEERQVGENITRVSRIGTGTLYFAVDGTYLVESEVSSDLSLLSVVNGNGEEKDRNFIRTRIDQKIEVVFE